MFCAFLLPDFSLQAVLRHRSAEGSIAIVEGDTVIEANPAARAVGVTPGLTPAQAMARCSGLLIHRRAPEVEETLSQLLLEQAMALSARVEATAPNCCTLDLHAVPRLAFTPNALRLWSAEVAERLQETRLVVRLGVARNPDLALLAARATTTTAPIRLIERDFPEDLPLEVLEPTPEHLTLLHAWGIQSVGQLRRLSRPALAARLGSEGVKLHDRATGSGYRLIRPVRTAPVYEEAFDFEHEMDTTEPLLFLLQRWCQQLTERLGRVHLVTAEMELSLTLSTGGVHEHRFVIPSPTAESAVLYRMLDLYLESLRLEHPLVGARLRLAPTRPAASQFRLFENSLRDPNRFAETLARLTALVGSDRVGVPEPVEAHEPDRFTLRMPDFTTLPSPTTERETPAIGLPLRRFRPPLAALVDRLGDGALPAYLQAHGMEGRVVARHGPYRLSGQWWEQGWNIEEWDVELHTGRLCRISRCRGSEPEWRLEGVYA